MPSRGLWYDPVVCRGPIVEFRQKVGFGRIRGC